MRPRLTTALVDRFWTNVAKAPGDRCWLWTSGVDSGGYGCFYIGNYRQAVASRWIFVHLNGPLPAHLHVCHHCDTPRCVRPDHLFAGTRSDNMRDAMAKGRKPVAHLGKRLKLRFVGRTCSLYCKQGHAIVGDNAIITKNGGDEVVRRCRTCRTEQMRQWQRVRSRTRA